MGSDAGVAAAAQQSGKALEEMAFAADLNRDGTIDAEEEAVQSFKFSDTDSNCCVSRAERRAMVDLATWRQSYADRRQAREDGTISRLLCPA